MTAASYDRCQPKKESASTCVMALRRSAQQRGFDAVQLGGQLVGRAPQHDTAALEHDHLVGEPQRERHRLLDDDHRAPLLSEALHDVTELLDDEWREPERELVDAQQVPA